MYLCSVAFNGNQPVKNKHWQLIFKQQHVTPDMWYHVEPPVAAKNGVIGRVVQRIMCSKAYDFQHETTVKNHHLQKFARIIFP
jgi:hypothetical protein